MDSLVWKRNRGRDPYLSVAPGPHPDQHGCLLKLRPMGAALLAMSKALPGSLAAFSETSE